MSVGYSPIPNRDFLRELEDNDFRKNFVSDHLRVRIAILIRALREQRGWSQAELGRRLGKPQSVISRLEDPDYGKVTLQTLFEVAAAFELPLYIDMPNWEEWFRLMEDMSRRNLRREGFDFEHLLESAERQGELLTQQPSAKDSSDLLETTGSVNAPTPERENVRVRGVQSEPNSSSPLTAKLPYVVNLKQIPGQVDASLESFSSTIKNVLNPAIQPRIYDRIFPLISDVVRPGGAISSQRQPSANITDILP